MKAHEVDYQIVGDDLQFVEIELDPGETVIAEAGVMMYMEDGIGFETKMGDGSKPRAGFLDKVVSAGKRVITGESLFLTHFTNTSPRANGTRPSERPTRARSLPLTWMTRTAS